MLRLLVATDGSENAMRAAAFVRRLIDRGVDVQPVLLSVHPPVASGEIGAIATLEHAQAKRAEAASAALARARELLAAASRPLLMHEASGDPAEEILRAAEAHNCDGIVMGRRGLGGLASVLLGSVSHRVSRLATVPVTVVP